MADTRLTATITGGIGSASTAGALSGGVIPVVRGDTFIARAQKAAGGGLDVILESIGGDVLAESLSAVAPGESVVSYGAAAGQADPAVASPGQLRTANAGVIAFSIINLSRARPDKTLALLNGVLALTQKDLVIPAPRIVEWGEAIREHLRQSEGRAADKTIVLVR